MARRPRPDGSSTGAAHLIELARETIPPVHPKGIPFIAGPAVVAFLGRRHRWISRPALLAAGASAAFFRHPARVTPTDDAVVIAPADGAVSLVDEAVPPPEAGVGDTPRPRVSTFLSIFDVHVQRVPCSGTVTALQHTPGAFLSADLPEASDANERTVMTLRTASGADVVVVQIAGLIARRIVNDAAVGDTLTVGDTYGLIRFGSRVDVYLPPGTTPEVLVGQRAVGAETVLARLT